MSKEAMKLALEALEHCKDAIVERGLNGSPDFAKKWGLTLPLERSESAITALREALAQPQQEPVAEVKAKMTGGNVGIATVIHEIYSPMRHPLVPGDLLYACPVNQAPVGWMHSRTGLFYSLGVKPDESGLLDEPTDKALPIYTSPSLPFGVGGGLVAIKTLLSRDPCGHANTAIQMIDAILAEQPAQQDIPDIIDAVEYRREAYGLTKQDWAFVLGIQPSHYSEFTRGQRSLPVTAMANCFAHGVPAEALFGRRADQHIQQVEAKLKEKNT